MGKNDDELVGDFLDGQESAFVDLVKKYNKDIYRIIFAMIQNKEDANDLTQEVFLQVYKSINSYKHNGLFWPWIYRIAQNKSKNFLKRKKIATFFSLEWMSLKSSFSLIDKSEHADVEGMYDKGELKDIFDDALNNLDYKAKEILVLKEIKMLEYKEIAVLLGIEIGTVKSRISRSREKLKKQLVIRGANKWI